MGLLDRLLRRKPDEREAMRPLWHSVVAVARHKHWFAEDGVPDTLEGRFDMVTAVLALVMLRMEQEPELIPASARLTEIFVEDMDGQLRQIGVGDLVVGKHMGKLMALLGGRIGAYRDGLAETGGKTLEHAVERNLTLAEGAGPGKVAANLRELAAQLAGLSGDSLLAGAFGEADR